MSVLFTDDFNRADNADLGVNWTPNLDTFKIVSNTARAGDPTSDSAERYTPITPPNDQWCEATFGNVTGGGSLGAGYGPAVRADPGGANTYYRLIGGSGGFQLTKVVAGTFTSLTSGAGTTFTTADRLYLEFQGSTPAMKKNGTLFGSPPTDSAIASGRFGVSESSTTNAADGIDFVQGGDFTIAKSDFAPRMPQIEVIG